jgi:HEAT repeat protein
MLLAFTPPAVAQDDEVKELVERIAAKAEPDEGLPLFPTRSRTVRRNVAFELLRRQIHVRDAALTLVDLTQPNGLSGGEKVFQSLGPNTRATIAPILVRWLGEIGQGSVGAERALYHLDGLPSSVIEPLRKMTTSKSVIDREKGCRMLGWVEPPARSAVVELRKCLADPYVIVRVRAARTLLVIDPNDAEAIDVLLQKTDSPVAIGALALAGDGLLSDSVRLRKVFENRGAGQYLGDIVKGREDAMAPLLLEWLEQKHLPMRLHEDILTQLEYISDSRVLPHEPLVRVALGPYPELQRRALSVLESQSGFKADDLVPLMKSGDAVRMELASVLGSAVPSERAEVLLKELAADKNRSVRKAAFAGLCELGVTDDFVVEFVNGQLRNGSPREKVQAAMMATRISKQTNAIMPALMELLSDDAVAGAAVEGYEVCRAGVAPLVAMGADAVPSLIEGLTNANTDVRGLCARALGGIGDLRAIEPLAVLLQDRKLAPQPGAYFTAAEDVRLEALTALGMYGPRVEHLAPVFGELLDEMWSRNAAIRAIGQVGPAAQRFIPTLLEISPETPCDETTYEVARAVSRLRAKGAIALIGIRRVLRFTLETDPWSSTKNVAFPGTIDLIVELGERSKPLIPELTKIVTGELVHVQFRIQAAYALAVVDAENPMWRKKLERWSRRRGSSVLATERLAQLKGFGSH